MTNTPNKPYAAAISQKHRENLPMQNPVIVALDVPTIQQATALIDCIGNQAGAFKVGMELFTAAGPEIIHHIRNRGAAVFLDLKYHDIPNTAAGAVRAAVRLNVQMLTIHLAGGQDMIRAAQTAAQEESASLGIQSPWLLGVSVLTSMNQDDLQQIGIHSPVADQVQNLVSLGIKAGLRGFVCSPQEIVRLRQTLPADAKLVTPGIRTTAAQDDQKRTMTPAEALQAGADRLVIGRPICAAPNPVKALENILATL